MEHAQFVWWLTSQTHLKPPTGHITAFIGDTPRVTAYSTHHKRIQLVHLQVFVERQPSIGKWIEPVSSTTPNVPGLETKQPGDLGKIMGSNRISSMNTRKYYQNYNDDHGESYHFSELG